MNFIFLAIWNIEPTINDNERAFSHWEDVDSSLEFDLSTTNITSNKTLRAVYGCSEWYIDDGNGSCTASSYTVTLNEN